ncbi:hypothetical protein B0T26DRAFT_754007 [Lasiosphaeria miniovina]|uniref:Uncharacterized protein n=1 Tax=Lasiosphaeria miniovina TaxID=1954250 RepID=A0AA40ADR0_9PEZI|nr:uncharacterized protein B0T26DRAFT_754007 [Lasiosphaeria miniovina]KAK0713955.1 hypothetical protein B0T26DRAFT_754007 [Lasiosphaeria miniovina]
MVVGLQRRLRAFWPVSFVLVLITSNVAVADEALYFIDGEDICTALSEEAVASSAFDCINPRTDDPFWFSTMDGCSEQISILAATATPTASASIMYQRRLLGNQFQLFTESVSSHYHCSATGSPVATGTSVGGGAASVTPPLISSISRTAENAAQSTSSTTITYHVVGPAAGGVLGAVIGVLAIAL